MLLQDVVLMSSVTTCIKSYIPGDRSSDVILPARVISLAEPDLVTIETL